MNSRDKDIFLDASEIEDPDAREAFLDEACHGDTQLREQVMSLLRSAGSAEGFLETPAVVEQFDVEPDGESLEVLSFLAPREKPDSLGRIGHFDVERLLGEGGAGLVFMAFDSRLNRHVAIKVLSPLIAVNRKARARFVGEAHAAAAVSHPHVTAIHAIDEHNQLPYLVMEYVEGKTLEQKIVDEGRLGLAPTLRIGVQIARGLAAAHDKGLIHRDVKPANVLLMKGNDDVKLTDFGLARAINDSRITQAGVMSGTPQYMSPEQAADLPLDQRTDLFSLGCVLYAMCTGASPFKADTTIATIRKLCDQTPRPIAELNPSVPDSLVRLINKLLEKNPDDRYQSASELVEDLAHNLRALQEAGGAKAGVLLAANEAAAPSPNEPLADRDDGNSPVRPKALKAVVAGGLVLLLIAAVSEFAGWTGFLTRKPADQPEPTAGPAEASGSVHEPDASAQNALFIERLTSDQYRWSEPVNLGRPINTEFDESYPRLSADGLLLVFGSNRPAPSGSSANGDIWMASRSSVDEPFGEPVNLGPAINSPYEDNHPTLSGDGLTIVFSRQSERGYELWTSTRASRDAPWAPATSMGPGLRGPYPYNALANLSADGLTLTYSSHQPGGGPCVAMRSARDSADDPWPHAEALTPSSDLPTDGFFTCNMVSGNGLAIVLALPTGRALYLRGSREDQWVGLGPISRHLEPPPGGSGGNAFERYLSADGGTLIYDAYWPSGLGGRDIWVVQRVKQ